MDALAKRIGESRDLVIEAQREMTARPAVGPTAGGEGESAKAAWLIEYLSGLPGLQIELHNARDERVPSGKRPNFRVRLAGKSKRTLWIIAHLDVVAPGDAALWQGSPWELRVEDDLVYGRGVEDNQQAIVSALVALRALAETGTQPDMAFGLICVADEENGNAYGLEFLLKERPDWFKDTDLYLVPDHGTPEGLAVEVAEKSMLWLRVAIEGKQAHGSRPQDGVNSLEAAAALILASKQLYDLFPARDDLFEPPTSTFVPTKIEANVPNVNILPGTDIFYLDCRILPQYPLDDVRKAVRGLADTVEKSNGVRISISDVHASQSPPTLDTKSEPVTRLARSIERVHGGKATFIGIGGGTVAALLRRQGIPAVVWSTLENNPHAYNEHSRISSTLYDAAIMLGMLAEPGDKST